jgi:uncharacterized protein (DUF58 family)
MVKEFEQTSSHQFMLLVELYLPSPDSPVLEQSLSHALALSRAILQAGEVFFFCYYSSREEEFYKHPVSSREDLEQALLACFYQSPYTENDLARTILERSNVLRGTILHVTSEGVEHLVI